MDFVWFDIFIGVLQWSGFIFTACVFALMCFAQAADLYNTIKHESDLERLLDTPQKRGDEQMEGLTTFDFPDEGPLTRICPECGALYPSFKVICNYDNTLLQPRKPITEPLPVMPVEMLEVLTKAEDAAQIAAEQELQKIWTSLENKVREYNLREYNNPGDYTLSREQVISLRKLSDKVHEQTHEGEKAS